MVIALASLILTPVDAYKGSNVRPYVTRQNSDISSIVSAVKKRRQVLNSSIHLLNTFVVDFS